MATQGRLSKKICFAEFELDLETAELWNGERKIILPGQPFQVLRILLERPGELVGRQELIERLWPEGTFVDFDQSLNKAVNRLRDALNDPADSPALIETLPRKGYRFIGTLSSPAPKSGTGTSSQILNWPVNAVEEDLPLELGSAPASIPNQDPPRSPLPSSSRQATRTLYHWLILGCAGLIVSAVGAFHFIWNWQSPLHGRSAFPSFVSAPEGVIAVPGEVVYPALSPDGKRIAFTWRREEQPHQDLYVQSIGADQPLRLTHNTSGFVCCGAWSPDGEQIAYGRCDDDGGSVFVVPAAGGVERKITDVKCSLIEAGWPQWTPDGKALLLSDKCASSAIRSIVLLSLVTGEKRCLTSPPTGGDSGDFAPSLGPDDKTVAFYRSATVGFNDVYTVDVSGKNLRQLTTGGKALSGPLVWTAGGYVVFYSADARRPYRVSAEGGPEEQALTFPAVGSLSRDRRRLAYVEGHGSYVTYRVELASPGGRVRELKKFSLSSFGEDSPQLSPDGNHVLVRSGRAPGKGQIWKADLNAGDPVQLTKTERGWVGSPHWSPDGKWVVMDYRPEKHSEIWMVDSEGGNFHAVIADQYENFVPRWSRDGRSIYFTSNRSGDWQLWKLDLVSGQETKVTNGGGISGLESYDGTTLYYAKRESGGLWSRPLHGGPEVRLAVALHLGYWGAFAVVDHGIYFLDSDASPRPTICYYDFRSEHSNPILILDRMPLPNNPSLTASRDGRRIIFSQRDWQTHINLAEDSK